MHVLAKIILLYLVAFKVSAWVSVADHNTAWPLCICIEIPTIRLAWASPTRWWTSHPTRETPQTTSHLKRATRDGLAAAMNCFLEVWQVALEWTARALRLPHRKRPSFQHWAASAPVAIPWTLLAVTLGRALAVNQPSRPSPQWATHMASASVIIPHTRATTLDTIAFTLCTPRLVITSPMWHLQL